MQIYKVSREREYSDSLYHHGIKGQKWGILRFTNEDGSLNAEGKLHYSGKSSSNENSEKYHAASDSMSNAYKEAKAQRKQNAITAAKNAYERNRSGNDKNKNESFNESAAALAAYNAYYDSAMNDDELTEEEQEELEKLRKEKEEAEKKFNKAWNITLGGLLQDAGALVKAGKAYLDEMDSSILTTTTIVPGSDETNDTTNWKIIKNK